MKTNCWLVLGCCRILIWLLSFLGFVVNLPGVEEENVCVCVCVCVWMLVVGFYLVDLFVIMVVIW